MLFNKKCVRPSHTNYHTRYGENYDLTPRFSYPLSIVIVDTTVAPALYVVGQYYSWALSIRIRIFLNPRNFSFADLGCVACVSGNFRSKERPRSGIFGFGCARNETRAKKWKRGWGRERKEKFSPPPPPLRHFSRGLCLSFLVLFSETTRKRSLRRLLRIRLPSNQMLFLRR